MIHVVHRIDGKPPTAPATDRRYLCHTCGPLDHVAIGGVVERHGARHVLIEWPHRVNPGVLTLWDLYLAER